MSLNWPLLHRALEEAGRAGVPISHVETNASWCVDFEEAHQRFSDLRRLGVKVIFISCTPFHAEFVPLTRTLTAISAAHDIFDKVLVSSENGIALLAQFDMRKPVSMERWVRRYGEEETERILRKSYGYMYGGRAGVQMVERCRKLPALEYKDVNCRREILESRHAHFDPSGLYSPNFCSGIAMSNARDFPRLFAAFDLQEHPLVEILVAGGPYALAQLAAARWGYVERPDGYADKCHLCVDVRRHLVAGDSTHGELAPRKFYEMLQRGGPERGKQTAGTGR